MNKSKIQVRRDGHKTLTNDEVNTLNTLKKSAERARGAFYPREVAEDSQKFTQLLVTHLEQGVSYKSLSEATGLQWRSIKSRIMRHGYVYDTPPSQQKKRFQGPREPGPNCDHSEDRWRERVNKKTGKVTHVECLDCRRNKRAQKLAEQDQSQTA